MRSTIKLAGVAILLFWNVGSLYAQREDTANVSDDLMAMLDKDAPVPRKEYTTATFKTTRIANAHSIENLGKGILDFRINHRFGKLNDGFKEFFGLDNAVTRIGFDYGITDWLMVGIGRSSFMKEYDGFVKARILRQKDNRGTPVSLSYVGAISAQTMEVNVPTGREYYFSNRLAYLNQLLIARKFNSWLSLQLMPTHLHYNLVDYRTEKNDVFALGLGGRLKVSKRIALTGEYYYVPEDFKRRGSKNSLTFGIDIETGGHVFQLMFSNSTGVSERAVIGQTTGLWDKGDIHFGFNISRIFTIVKPKEFEGSRNKIW
ncbi:MAG TPA: DUF5777 family beta-barrel protein [Flavipsychrobacter sp.]|nr:DUF5777 family beta-barrel protein [Flavipsychrobacter sp.]